MNLYYNDSSELFTKVVPETGAGKIIQFPLVRLVIAFLFLFPVGLLLVLLHSAALVLLDNSGQVYFSYFLDILSIVGLFYVYLFYTKVVEQRKALELSFHKFYIEFGVGALTAFLVVSFIVAMLALSGCYRIEGLNSFSNVSFMFVQQMRVGFVEELIFRVILFKLVEEFAGSWIAICVQGVLFGFGHIANPNATIFTSLALIIFFSILFGAGYMITRRIWFIMGIHWSWNFFQAGIFGMPNSGVTQPSLISPVITGPAWLTGGAWGIEASVLTFILLFILGLFLLKKAVDRKQVVKPAWKRKKENYIVDF